MPTIPADNFLDKFYSLRSVCAEKITGMSVLRKLALALGVAGATGLSAQIRVYLPWTPVPVTGQTLAVLMAGVILGAGWGAMSQLLYLILGIAGIPWFSGMSGGAGWLLGPTGGYIAGFVPAAFFTGYISEKYPGLRCFLPMFLIMLFANFFLIHLPGLIHFSFWMRLSGQTDPGIRAILSGGTLPFIPGDLAKITLAALTVKIFLPKGENR